QDGGRTARLGVGLGQGGVDLCDVVAVDFAGLPAEGGESSGVRVEVPLVAGRAALAETVDVDDGDEPVETFVPGVLDRLPHRPLGHLRVAAQDECAPGDAFHPGGDGEPDSDGQTLAE